MAPFEVVIGVLAALVAATFQQHGAPCLAAAAAVHGGIQEGIFEYPVSLGVLQV